MPIDRNPFSYSEFAGWVVSADQNLNGLKERDVYELNRGGASYILQTSIINPYTTVEESGWIYTKRFNFSSYNLQITKQSFNVNVQSYLNWYNSVTSCDEYGIGKYCWDSDGNPCLRN